jgi:DNA-binding CsgD family transcriptional regulator
VSNENLGKLTGFAKQEPEQIGRFARMAAMRGISHHRQHFVELVFIVASIALVTLAIVFRQVLPEGAPIWQVAYPAFIALFAVWGTSVFLRVCDRDIRRYLIVACVLMLFWLLVRMLKLEVGSVNIERWLWYLYYVPMILVPTILFWVGLDIAGFRGSRFYRAVKGASFAVSCVLLVLVLTNDLTWIVFQFPSGMETSNDEYTYGWPYWFVFARTLYFSCGFITLALRGKRQKGKHQKGLRPAIPFIAIFGFGILYTLGYVTRSIPFTAHIELTLVYSVMIIVFMETSLYQGLISSKGAVEDDENHVVEPEKVDYPEVTQMTLRHRVPSGIRLTSREKEMLRFFIAGRSPQQIASALNISRSTVDFHTNNLYRKMGVNSRHELLVKLMHGARRDHSMTEDCSDDHSSSLRA